MSKTLKWPFGPADSQSAAYSATIAASIANSRTELTIAQMTGAATLNLTIGDEVEIGDELVVRVSADATNRVLTAGTGMTAPAFTVTASKSFVLTYCFDGTNFTLKSSAQIN